MVTKKVERNESWARRTVARRLGRDELPDLVWQKAVDDDIYLPNIRGGSEHEREVALSEITGNARRIVNEAASIMHDLDGGPRPVTPHAEAQPAQSSKADLIPVLDSSERDRARMFSLSLAAAAERACTTHHPEDQTPRVRRFREVWFGGHTLSAAEAWAFVRSPAVTALTPAQFRENDIPPLSHTARAEPIEEGFDEERCQFRRFTVMVDPPGRTFRGSERRPPYINWSLPTLDLPAPPTGEAWLHRKRDGVRVPVERVEYWPRSLMDKLNQLATWLAGRFPWDVSDAAWFVLTGEPPPVEPLVGQVNVTSTGDWSRATITLTMDAWVSPESVEAVYRQERRSLLGDRPPRAEAGVPLWLFREQEQRRAGQPLADREVWRRWRAVHPDDSRYRFPSPFCRALRRAERLAQSIGASHGRGVIDDSSLPDNAPGARGALD